MPLEIKLALAAFGLESSALALLLLGTTPDATLAGFFLLHAAASACAAQTALILLPARYRRPPLQVLALLFVFSLFVPVLGMLGLLASVLLASYFPRYFSGDPFGSLKAPEFVLTAVDFDPHVGTGGLKSRLANPDLPHELRLKALLALQGMPTRVASPLLRRMLGDSMDDIRLIAYGLLDSQEKAIAAEIAAETARLAERADPALRVLSLRRLAELHWELVYQELALGDVRRHALHQAERFLDEALRIAPTDPGLWFLRARIRRSGGDLDAAQQGFAQAIAHGLPQSRALPYLAELAFDRGDYASAQMMLAEIPENHASPALKAVIQFWHPQRATA